MKKYWDELKAFYLKNRLWILGGLFFLVMMQICSQGGKVEKTTSVPTEITEQTEHSLDDLEPLSNTQIDVNKERKTFNSDYLLLLMGLGLLYYVAMKRKWFHKLVPSIVWVSLKVQKAKGSKTRLGRITIVNKTKENITFDAPLLVFGSPFKKSRKFRLKSGENIFPLTLTPNTSHKITIDLDQFRSKAAVDKRYNLVKVELSDAQQKKFSSIWKLLL